MTMTESPPVDPHEAAHRPTYPEMRSVLSATQAIMAVNAADDDSHPATDAPPLALFLADDHPVLLEGLRRQADDDDRFWVAGIATDGPATVEMCARLRPAVALVGYHLPSLGRVALLEALRAGCAETAVVVLDGTVSPETVHEAVALGARGYVLKQERGSAILDALYRVGHGETAFSPAAASCLAQAVRTHAQASGSLPSARESQILQHLADGATARAIGERLYISEATVKSHLHRLYDKLAVTDRAAAVAKAMRKGWLY